MKKRFLFLSLLAPYFAESQVIISKWTMNKDGKKGTYWAQTGSAQTPAYTFTTSPDSADVLKVCYTNDSVWVRSQGLSDNMGKYLNPGYCYAQNYVHRFPRNPSVPATKTIASKGGAIALLTNGIPIFGLGNSSAWNGSSNVQTPGGGVWNVEVGKAEGFVLDTSFGAHPQQQGAYHSHTAPGRLYKSSPSTVHSPLIGFAFDGYPIYGPYGYSTPTNASSAVTRMKSGYSLRNITVRTTLPYGVTASQAGPSVSGTYPLGTYCEDYEWLASNGGDLDKYNGRTCVTPEYPTGTYAYFTTIDAAGTAAFPYYIGIEYYGAPVTANFPNGASGNGLTIPSYATTCLTPTRTGLREVALDEKGFVAYPNPSNGKIFIQTESTPFTQVEVFNSVGRLVYRNDLNNAQSFDFELNAPAGIYFIRCTDEKTGFAAIQKMILE
jgi:YHYH protein/Secretion system C-terminal sorting domain